MASLWDQIVESLLKWVGTQRFLSIQLDLTGNCNLRCVHCYVGDDRGGDELARDQWDAVLDEYQELCGQLFLRPSIVVSGGEPLLSPNLDWLLDNVNRRWNHPWVGVLTNGMALDEAMATLLKKHGCRVQISVDGPTADDHEAIRGVGTFSKVIKAIRIAVSHGIKVSVQVVLSSHSAQKIDQFFILARGLGVSRVGFARFIPLGRGKTETILPTGVLRPLKPEELKDAYQEIISCTREFGIKANTTEPLYHLLGNGEGMNGRYGFHGLNVDWRGDVKPSSRTNLVLGNVRKDSLATIFLNHPVMKRLRDGKIDVCGTCSHYGHCGGNRDAAHAQSGDYFARDPGCWRPLEPQEVRR